MKPEYDEAAEFLNKDPDVSFFILILWHGDGIFACCKTHTSLDFARENLEAG